MEITLLLMENHGIVFQIFVGTLDSSKQRENFGGTSRFNVVVGFGLKVAFKNQSYHHGHLCNTDEKNRQLLLRLGH